MTNIPKIIHLLQKINKNSLSFNPPGQLIVRFTKQNFSLPLTLLDSGYNKLTLPAQNLILNNLLYPEDRIIRKDITLWLSELLNQADAVALQSHPENYFTQLATLFNLSALLFCFIGQLQRAKDLCKKQFDIFYQLTQQNAQLARYLFQPWINLGRIDRMSGLFDQALEKFSLLNRLKENSTLTFDQYALPSATLLAAIRIDKTVLNAVKLCSFLEPIKTKLAAKRYAGIQFSVADYGRKKNLTLLSIAYEAAIIACAKLGRLHEALYLTQVAINEASPHLMQIFLLHQADIFFLLNDERAAQNYQQISHLVAYSAKYPLDINRALFAASAAGQFLQKGFVDLAYSTYKTALFFAEKLADQLLMVECLEALLKLKNKAIWAKQLRNIIQQTGYAAILQRYPRSPLRLNKNLANSREEKANILFNKLMTITIKH